MLAEGLCHTRDLADLVQYFLAQRRRYPSTTGEARIDDQVPAQSRRHSRYERAFEAPTEHAEHEDRPESKAQRRDRECCSSRVLHEMADCKITRRTEHAAPKTSQSSSTPVHEGSGSQADCDGNQR